MNSRINGTKLVDNLIHLGGNILQKGACSDDVIGKSLGAVQNFNDIMELERYFNIYKSWASNSYSKFPKDQKCRCIASSYTVKCDKYSGSEWENWYCSNANAIITRLANKRYSSNQKMLRWRNIMLLSCSSVRFWVKDD